MFAVAFDVTVSEMEKNHPRGVRAGYDEIGRTLARNGFRAAFLCVRTKISPT